MTARGVAIRVACVVVIGVLFWSFAREIDWDELNSAFAHARIWPLAPAVAISFGML